MGIDIKIKGNAYCGKDSDDIPCVINFTHGGMKIIQDIYSLNRMRQPLYYKVFELIFIDEAVSSANAIIAYEDGWNRKELIFVTLSFWQKIYLIFCNKNKT